MNLGALILSFRVDANDKVEPYFHSDDVLKIWFNEAVEEACIRGRLIREWLNLDVCEYDVGIGQTQCQLHESLYEISSARLQDPNTHQTSDLILVSTEMLDRIYNGANDWRTMEGEPKYLIQGDTDIRISPVPTQPFKIRLEGYRLPLVDMIENTDSPELNRGHHRHLVNWVLHRAFSVPDEEFVDGDKAAMALERFEQYFGLRPDSDLRRMTRHDVPHVVTAFMP